MFRLLLRMRSRTFLPGGPLEAVLLALPARSPLRGSPLPRAHPGPACSAKPAGLVPATCWRYVSAVLEPWRAIFAKMAARLLMAARTQLSRPMNDSANNICVDVETAYVATQSDPAQHRFVFSYTITIRNQGNLPAKLLTRHWLITDANGKVQEVRGEGVVGEQPHLKPGEGFRYSSGAILETPVGAMQGAYQMVNDQGEHFDAPIAPFRLAVPGMLH